jgi:hypothetical protein
MAYRRPQIAIGIAAIFGVITLLPFFFGDNPAIAPIAGEMNAWAAILAAYMILWGGVNMVRYHGGIFSKRQVTDGRRDYLWSGYLLAVVVVMTAVGLGLGKLSTPYVFVTSYIMGPLGEAMFSFLSYYVFSAAFRAVRVRSWEVTLVLIIAAMNLMRQTPILQLIANPLGITAIGNWIVANWSASTLRAINIGYGFASIMLMFKVYLGRETGWIGTRGEE